MNRQRLDESSNPRAVAGTVTSSDLKSVAYDQLEPVRPGTISNPILRGFNPDPSIVRVGDDYYIATSTFEWFPGVRIHHSRDLIHWRLLTRPLDRVDLLEMKGVPDSGGIWAPCLSWHDGVFYLVYTIVHSLNGVMKDTPNFLVTARDIAGPWEGPILLNASGFDPSLFHDDDGRKWLVNPVWDHRPQKNPFHGIALQEYSTEASALIGASRIIFKGTELGCTEAPHLYKRNGYYYLMTAEGGTGWAHAVTLARSRTITGPYEVHPDNPVLTSRARKGLALQKAGHADLVQTQRGDWYLVHLCARPLPGRKRCILGRETAIQKVTWEDDWLYLEGGGRFPRENVRAPGLPAQVWPGVTGRDDFNTVTLNPVYQFPRGPLEQDSLSLTERPGYLRLRGGHSLESRFHQVLVARRQQDFRYTATTSLAFQPQSFQQMAGLVCYYSTRLYHYLCMSHDEQMGPCLYIQSMNNGQVNYPLGSGVISLEGRDTVYLRAQMDYDMLRLRYSFDSERWHDVGQELDSSILSDDYCDRWGFTGAFVGLACQDLTGARCPADFDFFEYRES